LNRVLFLTSHTGSNSDLLINCLEQHPRIQFYSSDNVYDSPESIQELVSNSHKCKNSAAIYGEHLLINTAFTCKSLLKSCNFIYMIRRPEALNYLPFNEHSLNYYLGRIRRIYEMAYQTPGSIVLTWDNLYDKKGLDLVQKYFNLKGSFEYPKLKEDPKKAPSDFYKIAEECYQKHLYLIKKLDVLIV
jgi:hypothetical protein